MYEAEVFVKKNIIPVNSVHHKTALSSDISTAQKTLPCDEFYDLDKNPTELIICSSNQPQVDGRAEIR